MSLYTSNQVTFRGDMVFVTSDKPNKIYVDNYETHYSTFSLGQLKLLVADLLAIISLWDLTEPIYFVFAGCVTGEHYGALAKLLPMIHHIDFWDPKPTPEHPEGFSPDTTRLGLGLSDNLSYQHYFNYQEAIRRNDNNTVITMGNYIRNNGGVPYMFYHEYLTVDKAALQYGHMDNVFFISDIRIGGIDDYVYKWLNDNKDSDRIFNDEDIKQLAAEYELTPEEEDEMMSYSEITLWNEDSKLQKDIVEALNPKYASLKFRLPFPYPGVLSKLGNYVEHYDGYVCTQVFTRPHSSEMRLLIDRSNNRNEPFKMRTYAIKQIEEKMFYYNTELRDTGITDPVIVWKSSINGETKNPDDEMPNNFDMQYMLYVLDSYLYKLRELTSDRDIRYANACSVWYQIKTTMSAYYPSKCLNIKRRKQDQDNERKSKMAVTEGLNIKHPTGLVQQGPRVVKTRPGAVSWLSIDRKYRIGELDEDVIVDDDEFIEDK